MALQDSLPSVALKLRSNEVAKKRKKRSRGSHAPGVEVEERRRERLEQRRQEKAAELERSRRAARRQRFIRTGVYALLAAGAFWFFFLRQEDRPETIRGHALRLFPESEGVQQHVNEGETVNYETTPPAFGQHSAQVLPCGIYSEQQPNEVFVHSLEHGTVGLLYDPVAVAPDDIKTIESLAQRFGDRMISMPYQGMEHPITAVSWGEMMELDEMDEPALRAYIEEFRGKSPEPNSQCNATANDPFQPEPTPTPSPEASPTPTKGDKQKDKN
jgi:hypothetical protein